MLNRIKALLAGEDRDSAPIETHSISKKQLAAAALLIEAAYMDTSFDQTERTAIERAIQLRFDLNEEEANTLIAEAEKVQNQSNQLLRFTRTVKDHFPEEERIELIEMLWEVVYADGELDQYESNLMRRIGGLIYVSDRERGEARKRVLKRLGIENI
jgi:uncharacterized tellurite resistance protein B-like protein